MRGAPTGKVSRSGHPRGTPLYAAEAAKQKAHGQTAPGKPKATLVADRPQAFTGTPKAKRAPLSRDRAAKQAGTSGRNVAKFKRVKEAAPDLAEKVAAGDMALDRAARVITAAR